MKLKELFKNKQVENAAYKVFKIGLAVTGYTITWIYLGFMPTVGIFCIAWYLGLNDMEK